MGTKVARVGDRTYGYCYYAWRWHHHTYYCGYHYGTIVAGSPDVKANGIAVARLGDLVIHDPNPSAPAHDQTALIIVPNSPTVKANGKNIARVGDNVSGTYYTGTIQPPCSPDVKVE